ncbi:hypothetical protein HK405_009181 [Cladochytrium tenue]|nr:hypothetical protein HK405_009181 [Cladochytrium tenue]
MTATDATPLPARHVQRGPSSASPSTAAYPIIPARNSSSIASPPGASKVRPSVDLPYVQPSDIMRFKPNKRSLAKMHTTNEWVQNVTRRTEAEGSPEPPRSFIGRSFDELRRKRGSTLADVGNDDDDDDDDDDNEVDDADVPPDGDVLPPDLDTDSQGDELQWRPTTPLSDKDDDESTRAPTDVDNDLMQKKRERDQLAAENKLISSKDFYKNARDVTQSTEAGPWSQEDGRSSPSPHGGSPLKVGKQTIKNLFMNTLTRTLRRNKSSNLRGGDDDVAATSSAPVAPAPLRLAKKSIDVPRWKDDTAAASTGRASPLLTLTIDRGRSRSKSRGPAMDPRSASPELHAPGRPSRSQSRGSTPFRSRSIGRLRPADVVAQAAAASAEPDAGSPLPPPRPTLDAVPPWNRTHEVRRELEERVGRSPVAAPRRFGTARAGRRSATVRGDRGDRQRRRENLRASLVPGGRAWDGASENDDDDYDRGASFDGVEALGAGRRSADNNTRRGGSAGGPLPSPPGATAAKDRLVPVLPVDRPLPRLPSQKVTFSPPASPTDSGAVQSWRPLSDLDDGGSSSVVSGSGMGDSGGSGRGRGSAAGSVRRSALVRSHTLGSADDRSEVEEHFVQVKALVAGGDLVAVKVSRNIPFAGLVRRLEAKAAAAAEGGKEEEAAERPVVTALEYVDQDGTRVVVADEEDWAVCLADLVGNKLSVRCVAR